MTTLSQADMIEATRLTREGRLAEATALLQGGRVAMPSGPAAPGSRGPAVPRTLIEMEPPSAASGGAWTAPAAEPAAASVAPGLQIPDLPPELRRLVGRMSALGTASESGRGLAEGLRSRLGGLSSRPAGGMPVAPPAGARFEDRVHAGPAGTRPYKLYVPSSLVGEPALLVMLHGCTQSPDDFAAGTRMNELAEEFGFLVAYPGQTQAANMQKCWNWFNAADQQRDRGEPSLIAGIAREVMQEHPVDRAHVYVAGLSAGGAKAAIMGAVYSDLFAAVGVHSGLACGAARDMPSAFAAMRQGGGAETARLGPSPIRTIVFHGDRDGTVHPVNADEVAAQAGAGAALGREVAQGRSAGGQGFTRTIHRNEDGRAMLEQWTLHGAGHAWSGGSAAGSYTDPLGPDASREMVRFFLEREIPAATHPDQ